MRLNPASPLLCPTGSADNDHDDSTSIEVLVLARMYRDRRDRGYARDHAIAEAFLTPAHRDLFHVLAERDRRGEAALREWIREHQAALLPVLDVVGRVSTDTLLQAGDIDELVEALHRSARGVKLRRLLERALSGIDDGKPLPGVERTLASELDGLETLATENRSHDDWEAHLSAFSRMIRDGSAGFQFGFQALDTKLPRSKPGDLLLIGAPSGGGKSTILRNLVLRWLLAGHRVALISCEMTADEQTACFVSMLTGIPLARIVEPELTSEHEKLHMERIAAWLAASGLIINERGQQTPESCLAAMRRYAGRGTQIIALDHLHRIDYGERRGDADLRVQIGAFARALKSFAKDHRVFVPALVQLTKGSEHEEPGNERIRESNKLLEEADRVLFSWLPLVACEMDVGGSLVPVVGEGGELRFKREEDDRGEWRSRWKSRVDDGTVWGPDPGHVYLKVGKQRIKKQSGYLAVSFDAATGLMYDGSEPHFLYPAPSIPTPHPCG